MGRQYTWHGAKHSIGPVSDNAWINSYENHKSLIAVKWKPENSFIFIATLELLMIKLTNSNMDKSDTNM